MSNRGRSVVRLVVRLESLALFAAMVLALPVEGALAQRSPAQRAPAAAAERAAMERQLQERLFATVQRELRLTPQQAERLRGVSSRTDERRRALMDRERILRQQLRGELTASRQADDAVVTRLLDGLFAVQRERLELVQSEQRELSRFLSAVQRARYLALQENWRRRVSELETRDRRGSEEQHRGRRPQGTPPASPPAGARPGG